MPLAVFKKQTYKKLKKIIFNFIFIELDLILVNENKKILQKTAPQYSEKIL